jgi:UPF0755 protein
LDEGQPHRKLIPTPAILTRQQVCINRTVKWFLSTVLALIVAGLLFGGFLVAHIYTASADNSEPVELRVEQGEPFAAVVRKLRAQRLIPNEKLFSLWARLTGSDKKIQWGVYRFDPSLAPQEVLHRLVTGKRVFLMVTIPEGLTIKEIAELLAKMQLADREKFLAAAADPELLATLGLKEKGLEGYLFPNTYQFTPMTSEKEIIVIMADHFRKASEPIWAQLDSRQQLSRHDIITLASIIEKETGIEAERPLVSAVFHNRLKRNMPLQSDPTVIYGLKEFDGNLTRKDLKDQNPYNTYRIPALPPGPICNPSLASIKAALQPADVPYLFFVSKNDGTHIFSRDLESHNQAVRTHQTIREVTPANRKTSSLR